METILVVDDEESIREDIRFALTMEGFNVIEASDGEEALRCVKRDNPSLVVLDIVMPRMDGIDFCLKLRQDSSIPIIFLSSKRDDDGINEGFMVGGDDYLTKPFSPLLLARRVEEVLCRFRQSQNTDLQTSNTGQQELSHCGMRINLENMRTFFETKEINLTEQEFHLLRIMMTKPEKIHKKDDLIEELANGDPEQYISNSGLDVHVFNIRNKFKKVGCNPIKSRHGIGLILIQCD